MNKSYFAKGLKYVIWACLAVIVFSPLYVSSQLFFPFITTKTFAFQIAVEVMFLAFAALCLADKNYRIHTNLTVWLILAYLVILTIASAFSGNDFYHSFWSNNEREDGILLLSHLLLFSVVLTGFFRSVKDWLYLFDMFVVASFAVGLTALDQYLTLTFPTFWADHFMASSSGARLAATIGNAGYVGGYMIFGLFISLFMFLKRPNIWLRFWYVAVMILEAFIAIQTQTRGAYVALALGAVISAVYLMWFYYNKKYLKITLIALIIAGVLALGGIFAFKNSSFIQNNQILNRVASISLADATANNRVVTWAIGWQAFMEKPILGWGQENFYQPFDKYYTTKNTEQWFDRCHNMICDRATTSGIIGLISYMALLLVPFWALWMYYRKEYKDQVDLKENLSRRYLTPIIFTILIIAYIIQNMFIFEALAIYVPLIIVLSFVGMFGKKYDLSAFENLKVKQTILIATVIFFLPALYIFNLNPLFANRDFIRVLSSNNIALETKVAAFEDVLNRNQPGNQEYRKHYFSFYEQVITDYMSKAENRTQANIDRLVEFSNVMEDEFDNQIAENPYSVSNYLLQLRFYNYSYYFDVSRLEKAVTAANKAISLSPGRPQVYYEGATSHYYFGNYLFEQKEAEKANEQFRLTVSTFYDGAKNNYQPTVGFDAFAQFLQALSRQVNSAELAKLYMTAPLRDNLKMTDITAEMISWISKPTDVTDAENTDARKSSMAQILNWLLAADKGNADLQSQLAAIK